MYVAEHVGRRNTILCLLEIEAGTFFNSYLLCCAAEITKPPSKEKIPDSYYELPSGFRPGNHFSTVKQVAFKKKVQSNRAHWIHAIPGNLDKGIISPKTPRVIPSVVVWLKDGFVWHWWELPEFESGLPVTNGLVTRRSGEMTISAKLPIIRGRLGLRVEAYLHHKHAREKQASTL